MKEITIELDGSWVLEHRGDEALPGEVLTKTFKGKEGYSVIESTSMQITLVLDESVEPVATFRRKLNAAFKKAYPDKKPSDVMKVTVSETSAKTESEKKGEDKEPSRELTTEDLRELRDRLRRMRAIIEERRRAFEEEEELEQEDLLEAEEGETHAKGDASAAKQSNTEDILARVHSLVGATEFKGLIEEILKVAPVISNTNGYDLFYNRNYLFSIGDGCGLSTYLEILEETVRETQLVHLANEAVVECRLGPYREHPEPFEGVYRYLEHGSSNFVRILSIDISDWMDKTNSMYFRNMLKRIERAADEFIVVFRIPFVEKDIQEKVRLALEDLLTVRSLSIAPFTKDELQSYAAAEIEKRGFTVEDAGWQHFMQRISIEKSDGRFYGLNTVKKVVRELIYDKQLKNAGIETASSVITEADMQGLCGSFRLPLSGEELLTKLVGSEKLKERIDEIVAQIELSLKTDSVERPSIHMRFLGNPGTGKTTAARIIGKILKERGVLREGNFYEYAGRDFCGKYIGETAPKTASMCKEAYGSVLFIDEAYSLYRDEGNSKDYGREAIDTLIAEMENHRSDFVVIMAGYTDDMERLMKGNQGLASRMPYKIEFPNFTREQLYDIFVSMVSDSFSFSGDLLPAAKRYFDDLKEEFITSKEFSNARFVRNLFERTWAKAAMRCQLDKKDCVTLTRDDFERAASDKEFAQTKSPVRRPIGF